MTALAQRAREGGFGGSGSGHMPWAAASRALAALVSLVAKIPTGFHPSRPLCPLKGEREPGLLGGVYMSKVGAPRRRRLDRQLFDTSGRTLADTSGRSPGSVLPVAGVKETKKEGKDQAELDAWCKMPNGRGCRRAGSRPDRRTPFRVAHPQHSRFGLLGRQVGWRRGAPLLRAGIVLGSGRQRWCRGRLSVLARLARRRRRQLPSSARPSRPAAHPGHST